MFVDNLQWNGKRRKRERRPGKLFLIVSPGWGGSWLALFGHRQNRAQKELRGATGSYGELRGVKKISAVRGEIRMAIFDHRYRLMAALLPGYRSTWLRAKRTCGSLRLKKIIVKSSITPDFLRLSTLDRLKENKPGPPPCRSLIRARKWTTAVPPDWRRRRTTSRTRDNR
jgi:hypothetical protein